MTDTVALEYTHEYHRVSLVHRLYRLRNTWADLERLYIPNMGSVDIGEPLLPGYRRIR